MPSPFSVPSHVISVKAFRWRTRSDYVTRKALAARNNEAYGQGNGRQSFRTVFRYHYKHWTREFCYWPFSHTRARNGLSVGDWPVYSPHPSPSSPPHRQPFSDFFSGEWAALHRLSETDNPSPNCQSKWMDNVRRIVHSKLKLFHFQIKTYYLPDANNQTDNPSHTNNPSLVWKRPFLL